MKRFLLTFAFLASLAVAQTPPTATTATVGTLREFIALLQAQKTATTPCLLIIQFGSTPSTPFACAGLGPGLSWGPGNTLVASATAYALAAPVVYAVTVAGTQTFTTMRAAWWPLGPGASGNGYLVYRNGMLLSSGNDYTYSGVAAGSIVTLTAAQTTVIGDIIQIW
jgi:hypothetical protein